MLARGPQLGLITLQLHTEHIQQAAAPPHLQHSQTQSYNYKLQPWRLDFSSSYQSESRIRRYTVLSDDEMILWC